MENVTLPVYVLIFAILKQKISGYDRLLLTGRLRVTQK